MALLQWGEDEDKKKDDLLQSPIKPVQSVQSAWQPTQQTDEQAPVQNDNYLLSDQKQQIDQQKRQRDAAEAAEAARVAEMARQAAAVRAAQATNEAEAVQQPVPQQKGKFGGAQKKNEGGLMGFVKNVGAGIQQGVGALGDIAVQGGGLLGMIGQNDQRVAQETKNVEKVRGWLHGLKDINGNNIVGTRDVEGAASKINNGTANAQDFLSVGGKSLQAGVDATMFLNPARIATSGLTPAKEALKFAGRDAAFYAGLQGAATGATTYGETGSIEEAAKLAAQDALIGGVLQGGLDLGGYGIRQGIDSFTPVANRTINSLRGGDRVQIGDEIVDLAEQGIQTPAQRVDEPAVTPVQNEAQDSNVSFQPVAQEADITQPSSLFENAANDMTPVADGVVQNPVDNSLPTDVAPVETPNISEPQIETPNITPETGDVTPVADGVVQPIQVMPAEVNTPVVQSEQIRALQESRAGKSQAEEAVIAQRIQELQDIPRGERTEAQSAELNEKILGGFNTVREQLGDDAFYNDFLMQEVDKPTRSADLAAEIIGKVENDGMSIKDAIDDSILPDTPKDTREVAADAYDSLSSVVRNLEKTANQPGLWKAVQQQMKGMTLEQRVQFLNERVMQMRNEGTLAKDFVNQQNNTTPPAPDATPDNVTPVTKAGRDAIVARKDELIPVTPAKAASESSLPDSMTPAGKTPDKKIPVVNPRKEFANRFMTSTDVSKSTRQNLANSVGLEKDADSELGTILSDAGVDAKTSTRITDLHDKMEEIAARDKSIQKQNKKDFIAGRAVNQDATKTVSRDVRELALLQNKFQREIDALKRKGMNNMAEKATQAFQNISSARLANMLTGAGLIERNIAQELIANTISTVKNPIKTTRGAFNHGSNVKSAVKSSVDGWKDTPKTASEGFQYLTGNTYKTLMTGADAASRARAGGFRTEATKWAYKELMKKDISSAEAEKLSRTAGNVTEGMIHMLRGVDNGMVSNTQAMKGLKAWKEYMRTGSPADLRKLDEIVSKQSTLADAMVRGFNFKEGSKAGRFTSTLINSIFPFMRTAYNLTNTGITRNLNPFSKSLLDEVRADQRSGGKNAALIIKNKLIDYGILGGAIALVQSDVIQYNDGDEVDKPRGISIKIGDNEYVSVRATPIEMPLAFAATVGQIAKDTQAGKVREPKYYAGMLSGSLPYIDQLESNTGLIDSVLNFGGKDDDGGYAVKQYGVNLLKSHVPGSNNGLQAYLERWNGNSLNAKKVYDEDPVQWLYNSVMSSYDPKFRDSLDDSRDNAGRVRTVDNQGSFIRKNINDGNTAEYNDTIDTLVSYARENKLGSNTQEMFNTYDTGKNNNFKSIQDSITFLDADGKPDPSKKLEKNDKLTALSQQIRDGFYGETGNDLLMLGDQTLKSDASVPNSTGNKNDKLPMNMQTIKNAIAATDLPEASRNRMYEISQANQALYAKVESKEMTYDQYKVVKAESEKEYVDILSASDNYKKMTGLMDTLKGNGFFEAGGLGSTKSGQTYLWNSLNALLGSKGATPAANYPKDDKGFTPFGSGGGKGGFNSTNKPGDRKNEGYKYTPVGKSQMANVASGKYTPVKIKVKLGNAVKKDKTQNYADTSF